MIRRFAISLAAVLTLASCGPEKDVTNADAGPQAVVPTPAPFGQPYDTLDEWHFFQDASKQTPAQGVVQYDVVAPLFSDYTQKYRFLYVPSGQKVTYKDTDRWDFPVGSIFIKTFAYPVDGRDASKGLRLLETRLLVREPDGWVAHTYEWLPDQSKAVKKVAGDTIDVSWIDASGATQHNNYVVPNTNICQECHGKTGVTGPLASRTREWNRDNDYGKGAENQIDHLVAIGLLDKTPPAKAERQTLVDPYGSAAVSDRGRSYLDANCSPCHGVVGLAKGTAFYLDWDHTDPVKGNPIDYGVCKVPASAGSGACGLGFDVVPGHADLSIVPCRVNTVETKVTMPPVGHALIHHEGVKVLEDWINGMPEHPCK